MDTRNFVELCKRLVANYTNEHTDTTDTIEALMPDDVYIVWYCKTLQNNKALVSTPRLDGMYYEVTYNGDKHELFLDAYKKFENRRIVLPKE